MHSTSQETSNMKSFIKNFASNESGATAIEYALIASLIAIGIITAAGALGTKISTSFDNVAANLK